MPGRRLVWLSLLLSTLVWIAFSWPLPRYVASGVPSSSTSVEKDQVRTMIMGDHLQMVYSYWIFGDMLSGKTRFFHNLYEFNTGNDDERRYVGFDFMPYTLVFTLAYWIGERSFAWNITGLMSLWLTLVVTWLLLRNYTRRDLYAASMALISIALPYLWAMNMGGSPTGYSMAFVPMLLWGIDTGVRRGKAIGGAVAGLSFICAFLNDAHVLLFSLLLAPCWALFVALQASEEPFWKMSRWVRMFLGLLPFALIVLFLVSLIQMGKGEVAETTIEHGFNMSEVAAFSPHRSGLTAWRSMGVSSVIYLGYVLPLLFLAGVVVQLWNTIKAPREEWRRTAALLCIMAGVCGIIILALGPNGPMHGRFFHLARRFVPNFHMIRQPAKIYCLLPSLLTVAAALALGPVMALVSKPRAQVGLVVAMAALFCLEYKLQVRPTVCVVDKEQAAYEAVAEDAKANGKDARAIVIPVWPGESAWSSLYQHYVSLYRIRMVNGYLPVVPNDYIESIYKKFEYLNGGIVTDEHLDGLLERGIEYLLLHEDAFPEQVSSFAVSFTLSRFLEHPRLKLLKQGENIWAFRVLAAPDAGAVVAIPGWDLFFPSYNGNMEMEWFQGTGGEKLSNEAASGHHYVHLSQQHPEITINQLYHCAAPNPTILLRGKGQGTMVVSLTLDNGQQQQQECSWTNDGWEWMEIPLSGLERTVTATVQFKRLTGELDLDVLIMSSGSILGLKPGEEVAIPAPLFFHAGYTDLERDTVMIRAANESDDEIFYGPHLPLSDGRYEVRMEFETEATNGTRLGSFSVTCDAERSGPFAVEAGALAVGEFSTAPKNQPLRFAFDYSRNADMTIQRVVFKRVE
jgi:hypothetical protein